MRVLRLEESIESFIRAGSGQIGWYDNMLLVSPNEIGLVDAIAYATYWLKRIKADQVAEPKLTPDGGTFGTSTKVTLGCSTPEAEIRYTLDGSDPTEESLPYP